MNKDCIKIDDMQFTEVHSNPLHGTVKARLHGSSAACKISLTLPHSPTVNEILAFHQNHDMEVYLVRKGSNMANLGMAIIKSSFEEGFTGTDQYESMAGEVRDMIGTRILTKVEPEAEYIHRTESDLIEMRIAGIVVCVCKNLQAYTRPDNIVLFEAQNFGRNGMVEAVDTFNTDYFKRRTFEKRAYNTQYVRPASEAQHIEYLKLKYEYLKSLENETNNYR